MEERLFQAACRGSLDELYNLVREDNAVLQKLQSWGRPDTPLHLASMFGHVYFVKEYMRLSSISAQQLCKLNQDGYSPLHLASANGHLDIVKYLLEFGQQNSSVGELCMKKDRDGQTALHCAVATGRVDLIDLLLSCCQEAAMEVTAHQETVLHLAVKYHQHEPLKFLIQKLGSLASGLLNLGDREGNTVLHLATAKRQLQSVEYLVKQPGLNVNVENSCGLRAYDVIFACGFNSNDVYIEEAIRIAGGCRSQRGTTNVEAMMHNNTTSGLTSNQGRVMEIENIEATMHNYTVSGFTSNQERVIETKSNSEQLKELTSGILVMASLIATVTFQVALTPPGGAWQDWGPNSANSTKSSGSKHKPGKTVLYNLDRRNFTDLMTVNTCAFLLSVATIILMITPSRDGFIGWYLVQFTVLLTSIYLAVEFFQIIYLTTDVKLLISPSYIPIVLLSIVILSWVTLRFLYEFQSNVLGHFRPKFGVRIRQNSCSRLVIRLKRKIREILH